MFKKFLWLEWKSFFRSASLGKSIALKIFMGFLAVYFIVAFLGLGLGLHALLKAILPSEQPIFSVNRFVLLWFLADVVMRFFMQSLPVINIRPLMVMPVKKKTVIHFVLLKSLSSFYNMLPLLVIIPFGIMSVAKGANPVIVISWMIATVAFTGAVNYGNFLIKKKFAENLKALLPFVIAVAGLGLLEYFEVFSITGAFASAMITVITIPFLSAIFLVLPVGLYLWNLAYLNKNFYLDASVRAKAAKVDTTNYSWTRRFGDIAPFLQLDLKLIFRNKRPRATVFLSFLFLFYGLIFLQNDSESAQFMHIFLGIFITGIFMINFGQFIPSWDSAYYPLIMSQNIPLRQYLASKAGLLTFSIAVMAILSTPYVYFGINLLLTILACAVYNIGINVPMLLFAGSFNKKKISLEKSPFMNYQGTGATQWIIGIPLLLLPMLIWVIMKFAVGYLPATATIAALGIIGILLRGWLMGKIALAYKTGKYATLQGFKQEEN